MRLREKLIPIGDWNMDTVVSVDVPHGLDRSKIRGVSVIIQTDAPVTGVYDLNRGNLAGDNPGGVDVIGAANITLVRQTGGLFDGIAFDSTGYNRGWIIIKYES